MLLATNPEIQEKVAAELKEVFYSDDVEISYDNITKLDLLERVIKESLRLCPVVPSEFFMISKLLVTIIGFSFPLSTFIELHKGLKAKNQKNLYGYVLRYFASISGVINIF